jgi:hypothetical protein
LWRPVFGARFLLGLCARDKKGDASRRHLKTLMTSYNQTVQDFSDACFRQLAQPLSTIDAINYGTGVTLVR